MVKQNVIIKNSDGLHLKPAGMFCKKAMCYNSYITFVCNGQVYNAKIVLGVLSACIKNEIELVCDGIDEEEALRDLVYFIENELIDLS